MPIEIQSVVSDFAAPGSADQQATVTREDMERYCKKLPGMRLTLDHLHPKHSKPDLKIDKHLTIGVIKRAWIDELDCLRVVSVIDDNVSDEVAKEIKEGGLTGFSLGLVNRLLKNKKTGELRHEKELFEVSITPNPEFKMTSFIAGVRNVESDQSKKSEDGEQEAENMEVDEQAVDRYVMDTDSDVKVYSVISASSGVRSAAVRKRTQEFVSRIENLKRAKTTDGAEKTDSTTVISKEKKQQQQPEKQPAQKQRMSYQGQQQQQNQDFGSDNPRGDAALSQDKIFTQNRPRSEVAPVIINNYPSAPAHNAGSAQGAVNRRKQQIQNYNRSQFPQQQQQPPQQQRRAPPQQQRRQQQQQQQQQQQVDTYDDDEAYEDNNNYDDGDVAEEPEYFDPNEYDEQSQVNAYQQQQMQQPPPRKITRPPPQPTQTKGRKTPIYQKPHEVHTLSASKEREAAQKDEYEYAKRTGQIAKDLKDFEKWKEFQEAKALAGNGGGVQQSKKKQRDGMSKSGRTGENPGMSLSKKKYEFEDDDNNVDEDDEEPDNSRMSLDARGGNKKSAPQFNVEDDDDEETIKLKLLLKQKEKAKQQANKQAKQVYGLKDDDEDADIDDKQTERDLAALRRETARSRLTNNAVSSLKKKLAGEESEFGAASDSAALVDRDIDELIVKSDKLNELLARDGQGNIKNLESIKTECNNLKKAKQDLHALNKRIVLLRGEPDDPEIQSTIDRLMKQKIDKEQLFIANSRKFVETGKKLISQVNVANNKKTPLSIRDKLISIEAKDNLNVNDLDEVKEKVEMVLEAVSASHDGASDTLQLVKQQMLAAKQESAKAKFELQEKNQLLFQQDIGKASANAVSSRDPLEKANRASSAALSALNKKKNSAAGGAASADSGPKPAAFANLITPQIAKNLSVDAEIIGKSDNYEGYNAKTMRRDVPLDDYTPNDLYGLPYTFISGKPSDVAQRAAQVGKEEYFCQKKKTAPVSGGMRVLVGAHMTRDPTILGLDVKGEVTSGAYDKVTRDMFSPDRQGRKTFLAPNSRAVVIDDEFMMLDKQ